MKMEPIYRYKRVYEGEECPNCEGHTENSEIKGDYEIDTWTCEECNESFCASCWEFNEIQAEFCIEIYCDKCYEEVKNVKD